MLVLLRSYSSVLRSGSARGSRGASPRAVRISPHPFDPSSARRPRLKRIAEVLGLAGHLPIFELHDAHRVRRLPVVSEDEFSDPEVASAEDAPHGEALHARLCEARRLNIAPAADALARLRILEHGVLSVNLVLQLEVIRVGCSPVGIQCRSNLPVFHFNLPSCHRCTPLVQVTLTSAILPSLAVRRCRVLGKTFECKRVGGLVFTSDRPPLRYGPSPDNSRWLAVMEQTGVDANPAQSRNAMPACAEISPMLRGLSPVGGKPIVARFDPGHLCSDGGLLVH